MSVIHMLWHAYKLSAVKKQRWRTISLLKLNIMLGLYVLTTTESDMAQPISDIPISTLW